MLDNTPYKELTIGATQYHIGRLEASDGGWIAVMVTGKMREQAEIEASRPAKVRRQAVAEAEAEVAKLSYEDGMVMTATFLISKLSHAELKEVQAMCMKACTYYENGVFLPVMLEDGRWAHPTLRYDAATVLELTKHSLAFNISPFFPAPASN
jgi:hypothetical protein